MITPRTHGQPLRPWPPEPTPPGANATRAGADSALPTAWAATTAGAYARACAAGAEPGHVAGPSLDRPAWLAGAPV
jgi:hypothetical protein